MEELREHRRRFDDEAQRSGRDINFQGHPDKLEVETSVVMRYTLNIENST